MIKKSVLLTALAIAGFAVTSLAQTVPNYVPSNGLVGWWPFNGNAIDESVNTNDGTVNGATLTADRFGSANSAYSFDGINDYISYAQAPIGFIDSVSLSFWISPKSLNQFASAISLGFDAGSTTGNNGIQVCISGLAANPFTCSNVSGNKISFIRSGLGCGSLNAVFNDTTSWHFIVMTRKNGITKYFYDGALINSINSTVISTINSFRVGSANGIRFCNSYLDDIGVWNRALTPSEITNLYNGNICYQTITVTDTLLINTNFTGFNPVTYQNTIKIWPNPTNDHITIDNGNLANLTGHQIKISNTLGQQVFQSAITQQQFYVNMSTWGGNGIYFVNLINAQGVTIETRKIILQ
jgi:hypothetical protein